MGASDAELVRRCLQGDNAGFDALVQAYQKQVYYFCYRMLGSAEESADAAQETFLKAYNALESFREEAQFSSWLLRIANNTCIDKARSKARRPSVALEDMGEQRIELTSEAPTPEELTLRGETERLVRDAMQRLPEKNKAALVLFHFNGMSIKQISQALGRPENTIKSDLHIGRELLRRKLEGVVVNANG